MNACSRDATVRAALLAAAALSWSGCKAFDINVGTKEPIKLDPIKVDLSMRVDVYQYEGKASDEEKKAVANRNDAAQRIRDRGAEIQTLKNNRFVGENHFGLLKILNQPAGDYGEYVKRTVDAENADRSFLMTDIANSTQKTLAEVELDQWEKRTATSFEGEWIEVEGDAPNTYEWVAKGE